MKTPRTPGPQDPRPRTRDHKTQHPRTQDLGHQGSGFEIQGPGPGTQDFKINNQGYRIFDNIFFFWQQIFWRYGHFLKKISSTEFALSCYL